jgi:hypothetical protein
MRAMTIVRALPLLLSLALTGCFTARAAVGPHLSTSGKAGVTATGGLGVGWSFHDDKAIYATPNFGVVADDHARAMMFDTFSYVDYGFVVPIRVDARLGFLFPRKAYGEEQRSMFGAGIAILPWHGRGDDRGGGGHSEKGWTDFDLLPDLAYLRGLGVEVAVDALPRVAQERGAVMATISLVGDVGIQRDR